MMTPSHSDRPCRVCGDTKPADQFYASDRRRCKACVRAAVKLRALTNGAVQEYDRARAKRPERVVKAKVITKSWRKAHPEAARAQRKVAYEVRAGRLVAGPCAICGAAHNIHAHHRDYSRPLQVTWLCAKCHHRLHAIFPELGGHFTEARP